ncbi:hypothetical protein [Stenotrophomonas sp. 278]|uniref:hypothetical protein n=1 Tax=Stenotrophomonas sp. 278 TaxID=2479851 RepID=UPI000F66778F|nr:hypothetical protein [Stenotrophomonas sp. 278]RRU17823.1 hypothetical protein EGJ34_06705 [Stenotrophomonas sp. 278]
MSNTMSAHNGYAGWFKMEAFRVDADGIEIPGSRRIAADWFPNLITNAGLDFLGTSGSTLVQGFCRVGTGNTAPANGNTALVSQVAVSSTVQADTNGVNRAGLPTVFYGWRRRTIRFAAGSMGASAVNLAEVGVSPAAASALFSRALILDGGGSPTTIAVQPDEVLDVTYELRIYPTLVDANGTVTIASVSYNWTARPLIHTDYDTNWSSTIGLGIGFNTTGGNELVYGPAVAAALPAQGAKPVSLVKAGTMVPQTYTAGQYARSFLFDIPLNDANVAGGIGCFFAATLPNSGGQAGGAWAWGLSPKLPKDSNYVSTFMVRQSWGRYSP